MAALRDLMATPIVVAPMAGGPTTVELVAAAAGAGALGMLAAGYKRPDEVCAEVDAVRAATGAPFGVNLFVPQPPTADIGALDRYARSLDADAARLGVDVGRPAWSDDQWDDKVDALLERSPAVVSFTFGCPSRDVVEAFRGRGSFVVVTVTDPAEAVLAAESGADAVCAQGVEAGAHRATFSNDDRPGQDLGVLALLALVRDAVDLPVLAAGGIATPGGVGAALAGGAVAVQVGTAFLRCPESGADPAHKAALADHRFASTALTRAFTGRRARALVNGFVLAHPDAPAAYPEVHAVTRPLRRAAAARGDIDGMSLWAGQGHRFSRDEPAGEVVTRLASGVEGRW